MELDFQPTEQTSQDSSSTIDFQPTDGDNQNSIDSEVDRNLGLSSQSKNNNPLSFPDMIKMASLTDIQSQQEFLKSKYKFAEPTVDSNGKPNGNFNVGDDPSNLSPLHPSGIGDAAINTMAKISSAIPSMVGQGVGTMAGAEIGTAILPGPGTIIGGLIGSGLGSYAGEAYKNKIVENIPGFDPAKATTDNIITGLFGVGGEALGQVINFGASKYIAPKIATAIDESLANNPTGGSLAMAKIFKFVANVDPQDTLTASKIGFKKLSQNLDAWNPNEIDNISSGIAQRFAQQKGLAKINLDTAESDLKNSLPNARIKTTDLLDTLTTNLEESGIVTKIEGDGDGIHSRFYFNPNLPSNAKSPDVVKFLKGLGAQTSDGEMFNIMQASKDAPLDGTISLKEAINTKQNWKDTILNKDFNKVVGNNFKSALYGEGASEQYPKGFTGLRSYINNIAEAEGHGKYIVANKNYENLMNAQNGVIKGPMNKNTPISSWMNVEQPDSIARWLKGINSNDAFKNEALENLHKQIGGDFVDKAREWATAQGIQRASPQLLRLSVIGSLMSMGIPGGGILSKVGRVPLAFGLASPKTLMTVGRIGEKLPGAANAGGKLLNSLTKSATSNKGKAILTQLVRKSVGK